MMRRGFSFKKFYAPPIHKNMSFLKGLFQGDAFQRATTRECDVQLAVGKRPAAQINRHAIKRLPLALVDRDGPRELERVLCKRAERLRINQVGFFVEDILEYFLAIHFFKFDQTIGKRFKNIRIEKIRARITAGEEGAAGGNYAGREVVQ